MVLGIIVGAEKMGWVEFEDSWIGDRGLEFDFERAFISKYRKLDASSRRCTQIAKYKCRGIDRHLYTLLLQPILQLNSTQLNSTII